MSRARWLLVILALAIHPFTIGRAGTLATEDSEAAAILARRAIEDGNPAGAWLQLERSRSPRTAPLPLKDLQASLYGSEAALLLYDGAVDSDPMAAWVTADAIEIRVLPARSEMMALAGLAESDLSAAGRTFAETAVTSGIDARNDLPRFGVFADRFIPALPVSATSIHRVYVAPPAGLADFPFEAALAAVSFRDGASLADLPVSYLPTGSMVRAASAPRLWSGNKLVILSGSAVSNPDLPIELPGNSPPHAAASARRATRGQPVVHDQTTASLLRRVKEDEPIVLHLDLVAWRDPSEPANSGILCPDGVVVGPAEIAQLGLTTDLAVVAGAVVGEGREVAVNPGARTGDSDGGGLAEAFLQGGARSVVLARWTVDPVFAERFLDLFYGFLQDALPRDEALRQARTALAAEGASARDLLAFVHWGAGNLPVYVMARKDTVVPLIIAWLLFGIPVGIAIVMIRRRYLRRLEARRPC